MYESTCMNEATNAQAMVHACETPALGRLVIKPRKSQIIDASLIFTVPLVTTRLSTLCYSPPLWESMALDMRVIHGA